jgi:hypothetical protein
VVYFFKVRTVKPEETVIASQQFHNMQQQSGQWFIRATDNDRMESEARLRATGAKNLPMSVKVTLRTRELLPKVRRSY